MFNKLLDAAFIAGIFILAFAAFGILVGAFAGAIVTAIAGKTAGLIVCAVVGGYVAARITRGAVSVL